MLGIQATSSSARHHLGLRFRLLVEVYWDVRWQTPKKSWERHLRGFKYALSPWDSSLPPTLGTESGTQRGPKEMQRDRAVAGAMATPEASAKTKATRPKKGKGASAKNQAANADSKATNTDDIKAITMYDMIHTVEIPTRMEKYRVLRATHRQAKLMTENTASLARLADEFCPRTPHMASYLALNLSRFLLLGLLWFVIPVSTPFSAAFLWPSKQGLLFACIRLSSGRFSEARQS